jgi:hypothetical protein
VAYTDVGNSGKATVMKFDGTNWVNVGHAGFSAGEAYYTILAISSSDDPYVAYMDVADSGKATVMKFNGTNWVNVGNAGFSAKGFDTTSSFFISLAFSPTDDAPYVAYSDSAISYKATVMKFDGTNWVNVGNNGFSASEAFSINLAFSPSGQPYVAYQDWGYSGKATVMKFDSVYFGINDIQLSKFSLYPNPAIDKITVELSEAVKENTLSIVNIEGQQLSTRKITEPKTQLDISSLPSGVYFMRLTSDRAVEVGKFVKE